MSQDDRKSTIHQKPAAFVNVKSLFVLIAFQFYKDLHQELLLITLYFYEEKSNPK